MKLTDALSDLKLELAAGEDVDRAIENIAQMYDLKPVFLRNRAKAALGDLSTWAERDKTSREVLAPSLEAARQKMARTQVENRIRAHNAGTNRVSDDELQKLIAAANALGGNWTVKQRRKKDLDELDQAIAALLRLLKTEGVDVAEIEKLFR